MENVEHHPRLNYLLSTLPVREYKRLLPHLECVTLPLGDILYESGGELNYAYFLTTSIVSLLYVTENGSSTEIAVVGNEGIVGIALFMGGGTMPSRAVVQSAEDAYRVKGTLLHQVISRNKSLLPLLPRYTQALITQMSQTAVCNRHHSVDQQLCRWLLLSLDRLSGIDLSMTQELIANMVGVRREGVTEAAGNLQRARDSFAITAAISPCWTDLDWKHAPVNVTMWSKRNMTACFPLVGLHPDLSLINPALD